MKIKYFVLFFLIFIMNRMYSQQKDSIQVKKYNKTISFVPDALIDKGIRIDLELPLEGNSFLSISPTFYVSDRWQRKNNYYSHDEVIVTNLEGLGFDVSYKYKFWNDERKFTPYFALNGFFKWQRKELDGTNCYYDPIIIDYNNNTMYYGERYYFYFNDIRTVNILRFGTDLLFGFQFEIVPRIVFDFSLGARYINTTIGGNDGGYIADTSFNMEGIGFSGFKPIGFYKIGVKF